MRFVAPMDAFRASINAASATRRSSAARRSATACRFGAPARASRATAMSARMARRRADMAVARRSSPRVSLNRAAFASRLINAAFARFCASASLREAASSRAREASAEHSRWRIRRAWCCMAVASIELVGVAALTTLFGRCPSTTAAGAGPRGSATSGSAAAGASMSLCAHDTTACRAKRGDWSRPAWMARFCAIHG